MIEVGKKAPNFKLVDINKNEVTLENFKGKNLILFFFPMAWTGTCTKEMCTVQEDYKMYDGLNTSVVGISVDTLFALKRCGEDNKIEYPLLSDFNKQAIKDYDVVNHDFAFGYKDVAKRSTFVIDKEGIVRYVEILASAGDFPDMNGIKEAVRKLSSVPVNS